MQIYPFGKYLLSAPDTHKISAVHGANRLYDRAYGAILEQIAKVDAQGVFLDIGANIGDTAALIATYTANPVLCVEGSEEFLVYLRHNLRSLPTNIALIDKFLAVEALAGRSLIFQERGGTGSLTVAADDEDAPLPSNRFIALPEVLERCRQISSSLALLKTDTDGLDSLIVDEAMELVPHAPLFFECDPFIIPQGVPGRWNRVLQKLAERGYAIIIYDNHGLPMCSMDTGVDRLLRDLIGYLTLQRATQNIRIHYLDVWAFPRARSDVYAGAINAIRQSLLVANGAR